MVCCLIVTCGLVSCENDRREAYYSSLADARRDGAIDRGWIPEILPESSSNIHELHEVSGGRTWCAFDFAQTDWETFQGKLKQQNAVAPVSRIAAPNVAWWPAVMTGEFDVDRIQTAGLELYAFARPGNQEVVLFMIDLRNRHAFFYRVPQ